LRLRHLRGDLAQLGTRGIGVLQSLIGGNVGRLEELHLVGQLDFSLRIDAQ